MSAVSKNRELSQFGSFLYIDDSTKNVAITTGTSPNVGIGSTIPTAKLDVSGSVSATGTITAVSGFVGDLTGTATTATIANYALSAGSAGIGSTASLKTSGIITASAFYINDVLLINPEFSSWNYTDTIGIGNTIYHLGNVAIGSSTNVTEKLTVNGNVSANRLISTVASGTAPFTVTSNTLVTNLNADFLRGKLPPTGDIVGTTDSQTLSGKTLTTPIIESGGATFNGTSGSTVLKASTTASGTLTLPAETGTLVSTGSTGVINSTMLIDGAITNADINASAAIAVSKLASSTISGVTLGNNLNSLSFGSFLTAESFYNGSAAVSVSVAATTANTANTVVARDASGDFTAGTINCSYLNATFDINSASDQNLKTNIKTIENSVETLNSLRGVSFDWKSTNKSSYGVVAQELEKVLPDLVSRNDGGRSVNYNGLIGFLIEAVKELSAEVEELKKKVS